MKANKSVALLVHPREYTLLANQEKPVVFRKNRPAITPPFKVYLYCSLRKPSGKNAAQTDAVFLGKENACGNGKVVGECVCTGLSLVEEGCSLEKSDRGSLFCWSLADCLIYDVPRAVDALYRECPRFSQEGEACGACPASMGPAGGCLFDGLRPVASAPNFWTYVDGMRKEA